MLYALGKMFLTVLFKYMGRLRVVDAAQLPRHGGVLLAVNHASYVDPPVIGCAAPRPIWFMAKSELFAHPFFAALISRVHAFP